jgi:N-dimethylarginine dimethylaminohydrolase
VLSYESTAHLLSIGILNFMPKKVLMCPPTYFDIEYEINPWMHTEDPVDRSLALAEWQQLADIYKKLGWEVHTMKPVKGLPDMVFTANGGMVLKDKVVLPHFRAPDRQPETEKFKQWFDSQGYKKIFMPRYDFEGEGDAFAWNDYIFMGYPWRSDQPGHKEVADFFGLKPVSLHLANPRFYHLDTALTVIDDKTVAIYPKAFSEGALKILSGLVPNIIEASEEDAFAYGLNAMTDGQNIVLSDKAAGLIENYKKRGMTVFPTPISEFQKSGGGVKCLTLELR